MSFTNDPTNNPIDRIRLKVGDTDTDEVGLSDEVYQYLLNKHSQNEDKAAVEALEALVAKYANYVTEKAGGLFVKESEKYQQYKDLLDSYKNDPRSSILKAGEPFAGGISKSDFISRNEDPDRNGSPFSKGYLDKACNTTLRRV